MAKWSSGNNLGKIVEDIIAQFAKQPPIIQAAAPMPMAGGYPGQPQPPAQQMYGAYQQPAQPQYQQPAQPQYQQPGMYPGQPQPQPQPVYRPAQPAPAPMTMYPPAQPRPGAYSPQPYQPQPGAYPQQQQQAYPPQWPAAASASTPPSSSSTPVMLAPQPAKTEQSKSPGNISVPAGPTRFDEIDRLTSAAEVEKLLNDEDKFIEFFESLESVKTLVQLRDSVKGNLAKEEAIKDIKESINGSLENYAIVKSSVEEKKQTQATILKLDESSEAIGDVWLTGTEKMTVEEFLSRYTAKRAAYHRLAAKTERFIHTVNMSPAAAGFEN